MATMIRRIMSRRAETNTPKELTAAEVEQILDRRARETLGISGREFVRRLAAGDLPESGAVVELAILVSGGAS
jgi:hypothetical protein